MCASAGGGEKLSEEGRMREFKSGREVPRQPSLSVGEAISKNQGFPGREAVSE